MRRLAIFIVLVAFLGGCRDSTERFVGTWHRPKYPDQTITIKAEGGDKISLTGHPSPSGTQIGVVKGDVAIFNALVTAAFKDDGTLVYAGWEYVK